MTIYPFSHADIDQVLCGYALLSDSDYGYERRTDGNCRPAFWFNPSTVSRSCSQGQNYLNSTGWGFLIYTAYCQNTFMWCELYFALMCLFSIGWSIWLFRADCNHRFIMVSSVIKWMMMMQHSHNLVLTCLILWAWNHMIQPLKIIPVKSH